MGMIDTFIFTKEELEVYLDTVKPVIVRNLVENNLIEPEKADKWCEEHTVLLRKKSIFRTLSDKWKKNTEASGEFILIVKRT